MNIRPSAAIRQNYNEIADLCRETAEPIFLTKNGEGDLVVIGCAPSPPAHPSGTPPAAASPP